MDETSKQKVILWSLPRSRSTAFERSIRELENVKVLHEPHRNAFYCGPDRLYQHTIFHEDGRPWIAPAATFEATRKKITSLVEGGEKDSYQHLFIKDISYYIAGKYDEYVRESFALFKHTFLIRHPLAVALSWYRAIGGYQTHGDWPFDPRELGMEESYRMYETVRRTIDPNPLVIDAEDLFSHPQLVVSLYNYEQGILVSCSQTLTSLRTLSQGGESGQL